MATLGVVERCGVDWRGLRLALGLTHEQMADLLCVCARTVYRLESGGCNGPPRASEMLLRAWLRDPELRRRLEAAGFAHPFPEDLGDGEHSLS